MKHKTNNKTPTSSQHPNVQLGYLHKLLALDAKAARWVCRAFNNLHVASEQTPHSGAHSGALGTQQNANNPMQAAVWKFDNGGRNVIRLENQRPRISHVNAAYSTRRVLPTLPLCPLACSRVSWSKSASGPCSRQPDHAGSGPLWLPHRRYSLRLPTPSR